MDKISEVVGWSLSLPKHTNAGITWQITTKLSYDHENKTPLSHMHSTTEIILLKHLIIQQNTYTISAKLKPLQI